MGAKTRKLSQINDSLIEWQSVVVADGSTGLTAVAGRGYFINTTGGAITVTLPSATAKPGDTIQLKDYARTWDTNAVSIASNTFDGSINSNSFSTKGQTVTLVYMDNTRGWSLINEDTTANLGPEFISATGGTVTTSGDFKIHTFTGDGCFVVATVGNSAGSNSVDYLVVAGGGGGGGSNCAPSDSEGGGGGAGGYRESKSPIAPWTASPLASSTSLPVTATAYPITVGAGGAGTASNPTRGSSGSPSIFSTITSTAGGGGGARSSPNAPGARADNGGSGGGTGQADDVPTQSFFGTGNTPPVNPPQGNPGGKSAFPSSPGSTGGGGGGGAGGTGGDATPGPSVGGAGGAGTTSSINETPTARAGGGGGAGTTGGTATSGGGNGNTTSTAGGAGTVNTGGGGGGSGPGGGGAGGKGIVIIRYKFQ